MFSIFSQVVFRDTHCEPALPVVNRVKTLKQLLLTQVKQIFEAVLSVSIKHSPHMGAQFVTTLNLQRP